MNMGNTTGIIVTLATGACEGVYSLEPHIPAPKTPGGRGIGATWPLARKNGNLTLSQRAVVLGADFPFTRVGELPRALV